MKTQLRLFVISMLALVAAGSHLHAQGTVTLSCPATTTSASCAVSPCNVPFDSAACTVTITGTIVPGGGGSSPSIVQTVHCTSSPCTISGTHAGNTLLWIGWTATTSLGDITAVSGSASGSFTHPTACNFTWSGDPTNAMDAWYKTGIAGGDTSVTTTSGHAPDFVVYELAGLTTFGSCYTGSPSVMNVTPGPQVNATANTFIAEVAIPNMSTPGFSSGPGTGWTTAYPISNNTPPASMLTTSSGVQNAVWGNYGGASTFSSDVGITFTP
jgi:hypothetical protein